MTSSTPGHVVAGCCRWCIEWSRCIWVLQFVHLRCRVDRIFCIVSSHARIFITVRALAFRPHHVHTAHRTAQRALIVRRQLLPRIASRTQDIRRVESHTSNRHLTSGNVDSSLRDHRRRVWTTFSESGMMKVRACSREIQSSRVSWQAGCWRMRQGRLGVVGCLHVAVVVVCIELRGEWKGEW